MNWRALLVLPLLLVATSTQAHPWRHLYGDGLLFDVYRDGKPVGQYRTDFRGSGTDWSARAQMELNLRWLFWSYRYRYFAVETWKEGELERLYARVDRNGEQQQVSFNRSGDWLESGEGERAKLPILATHHYDVEVVNSTRVLNTLTGKINRVTVRAVGVETRLAAGKKVLAQRYEYRGDLEQTSVWYDLQGRWVGLQFTDERGAEIEFRCRRCSQGTSP